MTMTYSEVLEAVAAAGKVEIRYDDASEEGTASPAIERNKWVTIPHPTTTARMAVGMHELGHHMAPRDHPAGVGHREVAASRWALKQWVANGLPDGAGAEHALGKRLHRYLSAAISDGKMTAAEAREAVGGLVGLLPYDLREPTTFAEATNREQETHLRSLVPAGMTDGEAARFLRRLDDWTWQ